MPLLVTGGLGPLEVIGVDLTPLQAGPLAWPGGLRFCTNRS
jgi:hypothetical protein